MPAIKDEAVCLRLMDWSETSQIAVLLTRGHGKVSAVAKGARRRQPSSLERFSGGLELLARGEAVWIPARGPGLAQLTAWDLSDPHWALRRDYAAFGLGMYAADLLHHLVQDDDAHERTFEALVAFMGGLSDATAHAAALLRFQWSVVVDMGLRPVLDRDAETGAALQGAGATLAFSASAGGVVEDNGRGDRWRVRKTTVALLRDVAAGKPCDPMKPEALQRANRLLCAYFRAILDKELPTMSAVL